MTTPAYAVTATVIRVTPAREAASRRAHRAARFASTGLIAVLLAMVAWVGLGGMRPAHAGLFSNPFCGVMDSSSNGPNPDSYGGGIDTILPLVDPVGGKLLSSATSPGAPATVYGRPATMYEQFGTGGLTWQQYLHHNGQENDGCFPIAQKVENLLANYIFEIPKSVVGISISMYEWASSPNLLGGFLTPMQCVVKGCDGRGTGLDNVLYLQFLPVLIVLGALYMGWVGLVKKRSSEATQAAIWMVAASAFAMIFMAHPAAIAQWGNGIVSEVNSATMTGVTQATATTTPKTDPCYLKGDPATKTGTRMAACSIYKALLFTPWSAGQFGTDNPHSLPAVANPFVTAPPSGLPAAPAYAARDPRVEMLYATAITHDEASVGGKDATGAMQEKLWTAIQQAMQGTPYYSAWRGADPAGRISIAFAALIASVVAAVLIILISFSIVVLGIGMLLLMFMSPLFLLIGAHPGFGRGVALKWLELLAGTVVKRITLGFLLAVLIGTFQIILTMPNTGFFEQSAMIIALGVAATMYRKPMLEAFSVVNFGGTRAGIERTDEARRHAKRTAGFGVGALVGGLVAARGGGSVLQGAARGGTMGQRSGSPTRAGVMGAAAGRLAASRARADQAATQRADDPLAYVTEKQREARDEQRIETLLEDPEYANDPEFRRRVEARDRRRGGTPRPSATTAPRRDGPTEGDDPGGDRPTGGGGVPRPTGGPTPLVPSGGGAAAPTATLPPARPGATPGQPAHRGGPASGRPGSETPGGVILHDRAEDDAAAARERAAARADRDESRAWRAQVDTALDDAQTHGHRGDDPARHALDQARRIVQDRDRPRVPPPGFAGGGAGSARRPETEPGTRRPG